MMNMSPELQEFVQTLTLSQEPKDRYKYKKIATEAIIGNGPNKGKLVELLYRDVLSKQDLDFGEIPDSKGNITKFKYYENIERCIESLSKLLDPAKVKELQLTIDLRNMIVAERENFEYGFKFNIDLIEVTYNTLVMTLMELINICIYAYVDYLKDVKNIDFDFKVFKKNSLVVIKAASQVVNSYKKGDWGKMMLQFKKATKGAALESISIAEESILSKFKEKFMKMKADADAKLAAKIEKKNAKKNKTEEGNDSVAYRKTDIEPILGKLASIVDSSKLIQSNKDTKDFYSGKNDAFFIGCWYYPDTEYDEDMETWDKMQDDVEKVEPGICKKIKNILPEGYTCDVMHTGDGGYIYIEDESAGEDRATEAFGAVTQMVGKEIFKNILSKSQKKFLKNLLVAIGVASVTIISVIAGIAAIRELVYYFYSANYRLNDFVKIENDFLKEALQNEKLDAKATARITRMSSILSAISGFIETKILKTNNATQKNLAISDKEIYSKSNLMEDVSDLDSEDESATVDDETSQRLAQQNISF